MGTYRIVQIKQRIDPLNLISRLGFPSRLARLRLTRQSTYQRLQRFPPAMHRPARPEVPAAVQQAERADLWFWLSTLLQLLLRLLCLGRPDRLIFGLDLGLRPLHLQCHLLSLLRCEPIVLDPMLLAEVCHRARRHVILVLILLRLLLLRTVQRLPGLGVSIESGVDG